MYVDVGLTVVTQTTGTKYHTWRHQEAPCIKQIIRKGHLACSVAQQTSVRVVHSTNHKLPNVTVAVALRCMELGGTHLVTVKMGAGIDQCSH